MRIGDMLCPWHPGMTLFECRDLHPSGDKLVCGCTEGSFISPDCDIHRNNPNNWKVTE